MVALAGEINGYKSLYLEIRYVNNATKYGISENMYENNYYSNQRNEERLNLIDIRINGITQIGSDLFKNSNNNMPVFTYNGFQIEIDHSNTQEKNLWNLWKIPQSINVTFFNSLKISMSAKDFTYFFM